MSRAGVMHIFSYDIRMKRMPLLSVFPAFLFLACITFSTLVQDAAEDEVEDEIELTPTSFIELLDDEGLDGLDWDRWTIETQEGEPSVLIRSRAYNEDGFVIFTEYEEVVGIKMNAEIWVYSCTGEFVEHRRWTRYGGRNGWDGEGEWVAWTHCDEDIAVTLVLSIDGTHWTRHVWEMRLTSSAIPRRWVPLAIQYHISRGHENFIIESYTGVLPPKKSINDVVRYHDFGEEVIIVNDEEKNCHIFETWQSFWPENHPDPDRSTPLILYWAYESNGSFVFGRRSDLSERVNSKDRIDPRIFPVGFEGFEVMNHGDIGEDVFGPIGLMKDERAARIEQLIGDDGTAEGDTE